MLPWGAVISHRSAFLLALLLLALTRATTSGGQDPECRRWRDAFAGMPEQTISVEASGRRESLRVKRAETPEQQAAGFQCATPREIENTLILFDFGEEILTMFHMQNVPSPLDIAFIKADGWIFSILRMNPSPTALYGPLGRFRYALEARAGFFQSHGIQQGNARVVTLGRR